ncbi:alpha/beta fold hydrolase [Streptomyces bohaiensis]|uniref:Alpha/beta hydrolase n=1 Tax=Streptomyces bohaiensis TaxID=1431344 RepID=A0ABX1CCV7_9ACTN|nr:alpha/beta hydrolase [Streptomyces bohaiensis]NJQ16936.1 alpha/beta hydrolase [Streptomyces bohaiensis]
MVRRLEVAGGDGTRLAAWDFSDSSTVEQVGERPGVLLLHGLMGRSTHWTEASRWLADRYRPVGLDQRGHGLSDRPPGGDYGRDAFVADAEAALEQLALGPAVLVGHAMGALTAWQLAARRPDLVSALVICDMRASPLGEESQREWARWYDSWPTPFSTPAAARRWFAVDDPILARPSPTRGAYYAEVMSEGPEGWGPIFRREDMLRAREAWVHDAHWEELAQVECPTLVIRGQDGELGRAEAQEMVRVLPQGSYADIPDAGHLAHHERAEEWRAEVESFLAAVKHA